MKCPNGRETNILSPNVREGRRASLCAMCSCRREKLHGLTAEARSAPSEIKIMKTRKTVTYVTKQEAECAEGFSSCQLSSTCESMHPRWSTSDGHISIKDWKDCPIGIGCLLRNLWFSDLEFKSQEDFGISVLWDMWRSWTFFKTIQNLHAVRPWPPLQ